jgi:formimidoylglutamase
MSGSAFDGWRGTSADPNDEQFGDVVESTSLDEADGYDAVLLGEPFDGAVIGRRGARHGPKAIRSALAGLKTATLAGGRLGGIGDLGDARMPWEPGDVEGLQSALRERTSAVHDLPGLPVFLGGDNSLTYPNVAPLIDRGSVGVVNFDAHLDVREVRDGPTSGTPYRQLLDTGLDGYAVVGARHFETSAAYVDFLRERGGAIIEAEAVGDDPASAAERALGALGPVSQVYLSVDLDVLDSTAAPGVSAPTPGGLSTRDLFRAVRRVARDDRLVGVEVVECAPSLEEEGRTAAAAARVVAHALTGRFGVGVHPPRSRTRGGAS